MSEPTAKRQRVSIEAHSEVPVYAFDMLGNEQIHPVKTTTEEMFELVNRLDYSETEKLDSSNSTETNKKQNSKDNSDTDEVVVGKSDVVQADVRSPWDKMQENISLATTQVEVLSDVLGVLLKTDYLKAEKIAQPDAIPPTLKERLESQQNTAKHISAILLASAENLELVAKSSDSYFQELKKLALGWRVSKSGLKSISCEFGNQAVGSNFFQKGVADIVEMTSQHESRSTLKVQVPNEYSNQIGFYCTFSNNTPTLRDSDPSHSRQADPSGNKRSRRDRTYLAACKSIDKINDNESILRRANHAIFVKDLFSHVAREVLKWNQGRVHIADSHVRVELNQSISLNLMLGSLRCDNKDGENVATKDVVGVDDNHNNNDVAGNDVDGNVAGSNNNDQHDNMDESNDNVVGESKQPTQTKEEAALDDFEDALSLAFCNGLRRMQRQRRRTPTAATSATKGETDQHQLLSKMVMMAAVGRTRMDVASALDVVASELKAAGGKSRLHVHWQSGASPLSPTCDFHLAWSTTTGLTTTEWRRYRRAGTLTICEESVQLRFFAAETPDTSPKPFSVDSLRRDIRNQVQLQMCEALSETK